MIHGAGIDWKQRRVLWLTRAVARFVRTPQFANPTSGNDFSYLGCGQGGSRSEYLILIDLANEMEAANQ